MSESERYSPEKEGASQGSFWKKFKKELPDARVFALMLTLLSNKPAKAQSQSNPAESGPKPQVTAPITEGTQDSAMERLMKLQPTGDIYLRFEKENADGTVEFNPWALVAPVQVELGSKLPEEKHIKFNLPYQYSRMFDKAEAVNPEEKKAVAQYINEQLKAELAQSLYFLDFSDNSRQVYDAHHSQADDSLFEKFSKPELQSLKLTGFASPEGPASKGPKTLQPGQIDPENISLAEKRARDLDPVVRAELEKFGIDANKITEIGAEELQFSDEEMGKLLELATKFDMPGATDAEAFFQLVKAYNDGKFSENPETTEQMNQIVASKRMVEIAITFKTDQEKRVVIPLPLTLMLLRAIPYLFRRRTFPRPPVEQGGRRIFSEKELNPDSDQLEHIDDSSFAKLYDQADDDVSPMETGIMEERMFVDEIMRYMGDPQTKKKGLDYYGEIMTVVGRLDYNNPLVGDDDLELDVAHRMLTLWQKHDRYPADPTLPQVPASRGDEVLDYHEDIKKIQWAKVASRQIIEVAKMYIADPATFNQRLNHKSRDLQRRREEKQSRNS